MRPATRNIALVRGDTYQHLVTFTDEAGDPVDITDYTYTAQVRTHPNSDDVLVAMDTLVDGPAGTVWLTIDAADTDDLDPGRRAWDLEETADGIVTTIMAGWVDVLADTTRSVVP